MRYNFIAEMVPESDVVTEKIETESMKSNFLTKPLGPRPFYNAIDSSALFLNQSNHIANVQ